MKFLSWNSFQIGTNRNIVSIWTGLDEDDGYHNLRNIMKIARGLNVTFRNLIEQTLLSQFIILLYRSTVCSFVQITFWWRLQIKSKVTKKRKLCHFSLERNFWLFHWLNSNCRRLIITWASSSNQPPNKISVLKMPKGGVNRL